jgi:hypothetical protein
MADISKNSEQQYLLNGVPYNAPLEWEDVSIEAEYPDDSVQPSLTITEFNFNLEARKAINDWIAQGTSGGVGIFEGMPFDLNLFNNNPLSKSFKAFIDFRDNYNDRPDDGELSVSIMKDDSLKPFFDALNGTTCGYLEEIGVFTDSDYTDIPYVVEKKFNLFEILMASIVLYLMVKELSESIYRTADAIATVASLLLFVGTGSLALGSAFLAVAKAAINLAYTVVLLLAIIDLSKTLIETLLPPKRIHKGILLKTALTKIANHFGYQFTTSVSEYENVYYLPSNPNLDEKVVLGFIGVTAGTPKGIPSVLDYGYFTEDLFNLAKTLPYAKMALIGNTIHLRPKNDPFWIQQTQWELPDVLVNTLRYNLDDMRATRLYSFAVDTSDEWTIDNYDRTAVEIKTTPSAVINERAVLLKGLEEVDFQTALGNRKDELNALEKLLKKVAGAIDDLTGLFGGGTDFAGEIDSKVGILKQTSNWHTIPKLLYLSGGLMPTNHRSLWNAELLWDKYHIEKSFVSGNFNGQKQVYNDVNVPFGLEDFFQLTSNPYFKFNGEQAKITKFVWTVGEDSATINFTVKKPYTYNLKETKLIPE